MSGVLEPDEIIPIMEERGPEMRTKQGTPTPTPIICQNVLDVHM